MQIKIRLASNDDITKINKIYQYARAFMIKSGNPNQWEEGYPSIEMIKDDITLQELYVVSVDDKIEGVFMLSLEGDEDYQNIDGKWLNDADYGVIHRIARSNRIKHMLQLVVDYSLTFTDNLRIDTHEDNLVMRNALKRNGFTYCGIVWVRDSKRLAYQKEKVYD